MTLPDPLLRYPWRPDATSYVVVVEVDGSAENLTFPASGSLDTTGDYFWIGDDSVFDLARLLGECMEGHTAITTCAVTFNADWTINIDPTGSGTDHQIIWSSSTTTLPAEVFGFVDGVDSELNPNIDSDNIPFGIVLPGHPVNVDMRNRQPVVGGISKSISGLTRASTFGTPLKMRTLEWQLINASVSLDEYAPTTAPYATIESLFREALSLGRPIHYCEDASDLETYTVLRLSPPLRDTLTRDERYIVRWNWRNDFIVDANVDADALPSYDWAPIDITGAELYLAAAPLNHLWVARDGSTSVATTRVAVATDLVGRVDSSAPGTHVALAGADAQRPVYRTSPSPHFEFDGTDDRWTVHNTDAGGFNYFCSTGVGSILMHCGFAADGTVETILDSSGGPAAGNGINVIKTAANVIRVTVRAQGGVTVFDYSSSATVTAAQGIVPIEIRLNNASGGDLRINGGTLETFARSNPPAATATMASSLIVGSRNSGTDAGAINLADVLITNTYVSNADCALFRNYSLVADAPTTYLRQTGLPVAGGAPWFNMLYRWYDFTDESTLWTDARVTNVVANNDPIQVADHASDNTAQHLNRTITGAGGARPLWQNDGTGSDWDGSNDVMTVAVGEDMFGAAKTIVYVARNDDAVNGSYVMNSNGSWRILTSSADVLIGAGSTSAVNLGSNTGFNILAFVRDGQNWTSRARGGGVENTASDTDAGAARTHTFGQGAVAGNYMDGRIVEVLVFHAALSDDELDVVFAGLADKHPGLSL